MHCALTIGSLFSFTLGFYADINPRYKGKDFFANTISWRLCYSITKLKLFKDVFLLDKKIEIVDKYT